MSDPFGGAVSQLLREASGSIPYNIPDESIYLESVRGLRSELDDIISGTITINPSTIDHDLLLNFEQNEHYLQSAISIAFTQLTGKIVDAQVDSAVTYTNLQSLNTLHVKSTSGGQAMLIDGGSSWYVNFGASGFSGPSFNSYSDGVKIVLWDNISSSRAGVALGVTAAGNLWLGVDWVVNDIKFYAGTTLLLTMQQNHTFVPGRLTAETSVTALNANALSRVGIGTGVIPGGAKPSLHWFDRLTNNGDIGGEISINLVGVIKDVMIFKKEVTEFVLNPVSMLGLTLTGSLHVGTSLTVGGSTNDAFGNPMVVLGSRWKQHTCHRISRRARVVRYL